jgi:hypothetical protein
MQQQGDSDAGPGAQRTGGGIDQPCPSAGHQQLERFERAGIDRQHYRDDSGIAGAGIAKGQSKGAQEVRT